MIYQNAENYNYVGIGSVENAAQMRIAFSRFIVVKCAQRNLFVVGFM